MMKKKGCEIAKEAATRNEPAYSYTTISPHRRSKLQGLKHSVKVVIRGAAHTGKTCFYHALCGEGRPESYLSTPYIQIAVIPWASETGKLHDTRMEIWDVVDHGCNENVPDARNVDVYRNADVVIYVMDVTRRCSFDYTRASASNLGTNFMVLVLANFSDKQSSSLISEHEVRSLCREIDDSRQQLEASRASSDIASSRSSRMHTRKFIPTQFVTTSMVTMQGFHEIHRFLMMTSVYQSIRAYEEKVELLWNDVIQKGLEEFELLREGTLHDHQSTNARIIPHATKSTEISAKPSEPTEKNINASRSEDSERIAHVSPEESVHTNEVSQSSLPPVFENRNITQNKDIQDEKPNIKENIDKSTISSLSNTPEMIESFSSEQEENHKFWAATDLVLQNMSDKGVVGLRIFETRKGGIPTSVENEAKQINSLNVPDGDFECANTLRETISKSVPLRKRAAKKVPPRIITQLQ